MMEIIAKTFLRKVGPALVGLFLVAAALSIASPGLVPLSWWLILAGGLALLALVEIAFARLRARP